MTYPADFRSEAVESVRITGSIAAVAMERLIAEPTLRAWCNAAGINLAAQRRRRREWLWGDILRRVDAGESTDQIHGELDGALGPYGLVRCSPSLVKKVRRHAGRPGRANGRPPSARVTLMVRLPELDRMLAARFTKAAMCRELGVSRSSLMRLLPFVCPFACERCGQPSSTTVHATCQ